MASRAGLSGYRILGATGGLDRFLTALGGSGRPDASFGQESQGVVARDPTPPTTSTEPADETPRAAVLEHEHAGDRIVHPDIKTDNWKTNHVAVNTRRIRVGRHRAIVSRRTRTRDGEPTLLLL